MVASASASEVTSPSTSPPNNAPACTWVNRPRPDGAIHSRTRCKTACGLPRCLGSGPHWWWLRAQELDVSPASAPAQEIVGHGLNTSSCHAVAGSAPTSHAEKPMPCTRFDGGSRLVRLACWVRCRFRPSLRYGHRRGTGAGRRPAGGYPSALLEVVHPSASTTRARLGARHLRCARAPARSRWPGGRPGGSSRHWLRQLLVPTPDRVSEAG